MVVVVVEVVVLGMLGMEVVLVVVVEVVVVVVVEVVMVVVVSEVEVVVVVVTPVVRGEVRFRVALLLIILKLFILVQRIISSSLQRSKQHSLKMDTMAMML